MTYVSKVLAPIALLMALHTVASAQQAPVPRPAKAGRKYTVKIDSSPQQAAIYLDDKKYGIVGYTPYSGKLAKGQWTLIVELPGYAPYSQIITVDRTHKDFMVVLQKVAQPGVIDVQATADQNVNGAQVFVDGQLEGTAPTLVQVKDGRHLVEIKKEEFHDFQQWVNLTEGQVVTLTPVLKAKVKATPKGSLLVDADVSDAEVYINGKKQLDTTPTVIDNLDEGDYIVEVRKAPATPWKQSVYVKGGQRTKVTAELKATMGSANKGGTVRVLSNVATAEVYLDGTYKGVVPLDLTGTAAGTHLIECRAKGYVSQEKSVTVNEGSADIVKFDLVATSVNTSTTGKIKVVSPVEEAKVFIDGANVGTAPIEKEVSAGEHFVVVSQVGYTKFEQKVAVDPGQTITITAQLKAVGAVRFLSTPETADILIDDEPVGKTPHLKEDVDVGEHVITMRVEGYYDFEETVRVEGGKIAVINATLKKIDTGKSDETILKEKWALTSYGARVMPFGRFTVDGMAGYPYWTEARATVGVADEKAYGWDVGIGFRSLLTNWEFLGTVRYRFFQKTPFAAAAFGTVGGGGGFSGRNSFTLQGGGLFTITFQGGLHAVTLTGRAYLDVWSDRLCGLDDKDVPIEDGVPDVCKMNAPTDAPDYPRAQELTGNTDLHDRDFGVRAFLSFVAEVALTQKVSAFLIFEGAPFQGQRAAYTGIFNGTMVSDEDPIYNGKLGLTLKF